MSTDYTVFETWQDIHEMCGAVLPRAVQTDSLKAVQILWENESHNTRRRRVGFARWWCFHYTVRKIFVLVRNVADHMHWMSCSIHQSHISHDQSHIYIDVKFSMPKCLKKVVHLNSCHVSFIAGKMRVTPSFQASLSHSLSKQWAKERTG